MDSSADTPRLDMVQGLLWPLKPRDLAERIGLDWWAALKLYDDGWLSFNPATDEITDAETEAEFVFLGSLVAAGCDPQMLKRLLAGLEKPYRYDIGRMYYDWRQRQWQNLPLPPEEPEIPSPEEPFEPWLDELVEKQDVDTLSDIVDAVGAALDRAEEALGKGVGSEGRGGESSGPPGAAFRSGGTCHGGGGRREAQG